MKLWFTLICLCYILTHVATVFFVLDELVDALPSALIFVLG